MLRHCFATTERSPRDVRAVSTIFVDHYSTDRPICLASPEDHESHTFDGQPMGTPLCLSRSPSTPCAESRSSAAAQDAADPVERVATMTPMPVDIVLHAAAHLVERGQPELGDMERVEHANRVRELLIQRGGVAAERVQRCGRDLRLPLVVALVQPGGQHHPGPAGDHVAAAAPADPVSGRRCRSHT